MLWSMHLMLLIGQTRPIQGRHPDFMVFLEYDNQISETGGLPASIGFLSSTSGSRRRRVIWVPALVAFVFGWLAFPLPASRASISPS